MEIIPGILEKEWGEIERKINLVKSFTKSASAAAAIHIDIIDGKFAPNATFIGPLAFKKFTKDLFFELHMMVEDPVQYLKPFADAGFKRFLGHIEKMPDQVEFVSQAKALGEVGLAIDGPTNLSLIKIPYEDLDCLLIMTVKAGKSGQKFDPKYLKKVDDPSTVLWKAWHRSGLVIEVDGGINDQTIIEAKNIGATRFVTNSFIFNAKNPQKQYNLLSVNTINKKW